MVDVDDLLEAQAKGEIENLKFQADDEGLVATFNFKEESVDFVAFKVASVSTKFTWEEISGQS